MNDSMDGSGTRKTLVALFVGLLGVGVAYPQETVPLRTRNLSPLVSIFGLPAWEIGLGDERSEFAVVGEIGNHYRLASKGEEELVFDGETWRTSFFYRHRVLERWSVGFEIPLYRHSGGFVDDLVDAWHSFFRLPDGNRNLRPEDQLRYLYNDRGETTYFLDQPSSGIGDVQISVARELDGADGLLLRAVLKLPTGDAADLTGSGGTDLSVSVLKRSPRTFVGDSAGIYWGAGLLMIGEPDVFATRHEDWVVFGMFGGSWRPFPRIGLRAQLDFHSRFYDSELEEMGKDAIQASIGGWWSLDERRRVNFAVGEDLVVKTSPDVSIHVDFTWGF